VGWPFSLPSVFVGCSCCWRCLFGLFYLVVGGLVPVAGVTILFMFCWFFLSFCYVLLFGFLFLVWGFFLRVLVFFGLCCLRVVFFFFCFFVFDLLVVLLFFFFVCFLDGFFLCYFGARFWLLFLV